MLISEIHMEMPALRKAKTKLEIHNYSKNDDIVKPVPPARTLQQWHQDRQMEDRYKAQRETTREFTLAAGPKAVPWGKRNLLNK